MHIQYVQRLKKLIQFCSIFFLFLNNEGHLSKSYIFPLIFNFYQVIAFLYLFKKIDQELFVIFLCFFNSIYRRLFLLLFSLNKVCLKTINKKITKSNFTRRYESKNCIAVFNWCLSGAFFLKTNSQHLIGNRRKTKTTN